MTNSANDETSHDGLYILLLSIHGLIRGENLELGRDPDTGGQTTYVVELTRALACHPAVDRVDLLTRQVIDRRVDDSYAESVEPLAPGANIIRIPCGPRRYLRKEKLWPYLDSYTDHILYHIRMVGRQPDLVHGHYADAGCVGAHLASLLGVPFVFTGHSLGRVKKARLLESGAQENTLEGRFHFTQRIEAEEQALDTATLVVASTHQEVEQQYALYDHYDPNRMEVVPPGVDLSRFLPPTADGHGDTGADLEQAVGAKVGAFLADPHKPMIFAMARPDVRKNFYTLLSAYGGDAELRRLANLVLVAGNRDVIPKMDAASRRVLTDILLLIDQFDLYGSVAYPKEHTPEEVPAFYRMVARSGGVFVNPALTEPFGLTLIEAAGSGLPIVATNDGGPRDIIGNCDNGLLVDPNDGEAICAAIKEVLSDREQWQRYSRAGLTGVHEHYTWEGHVRRYLSEVQSVREGARPGFDLPNAWRSRLTTVDRLLVTDIDSTLTGDPEGLDALIKQLEEGNGRVGFGIATGRCLDKAREVLDELEVPTPDLLITSVGTEIHYGRDLSIDRSWRKHIDYRWYSDRVRAALAELPGLEPQEKEAQQPFKVSFYVDAEHAPTLRQITRHLRQHKLQVKLFYSHGAFLDATPLRGTPGQAIRYLACKWGIPPERILVAGDSGNDEDMLSGNTLGVVVGNYSTELERLRGRPRIYFARSHHSWGILEGMDHYDFYGNVCVDPEA